MSRLFEGSYMGDGSKLEDDTRLECGICWWVYDPALGDEVAQMQPGTPFCALPEPGAARTATPTKHKFLVLGSVDRPARHDPVEELPRMPIGARRST